MHLEWGTSRLQALVFLGMEKHSGRDRAGKQGGAAGLGGHSSAKVTSESHSCSMRGESRPPPPFLDTAQPRGLGPQVPPAGLSPCPQLGLLPLLQASPGTAGAGAGSEGGVYAPLSSRTPKEGAQAPAPSHTSLGDDFDSSTATCRALALPDPRLTPTLSLSHLGLPVGSTDFSRSTRH